MRSGDLVESYGDGGGFSLIRWLADEADSFKRGDFNFGIGAVVDDDDALESKRMNLGK